MILNHTGLFSSSYIAKGGSAGQGNILRQGEGCDALPKKTA